MSTKNFIVHPKELSITRFSYNLPEEKIAFHPLEKRSQSKLLIYKNGEIGQDTYANISHHIPANTFLVFNNTRVVEARLLFQKSTGGIIEIFCLEPHESYADITTAMNQTAHVKWLCLIGGASKWKNGTVLTQKFIIDGQQVLLEAIYIEKRSDCFEIELKWDIDTISFAEILHHAGKVPLPPYIKREAEIEDTERYQTIYAQLDGSVAAPTAGLHFTKDILAALKKKKIDIEFVTLHVGAGTFKPVNAEKMEGHEMHAEYIEVSAPFIEKLLLNDQALVAVGTTSLRTIESLYWIGCKLLEEENIFDDKMPFITQWEVYEPHLKKHNVHAALNGVLQFLKRKKTNTLIAKTQIIIAPGYEFKIVDGLITNFHQPSSTLLLLVAAFIGHDWETVYNYALQNNFRFLSYGDGSLLWGSATASSSRPEMHV